MGLLAALFGCAATPGPRVPAWAIERSEVTPEGYATVGRASASCVRDARWRSRRDAPLASFDCSRERLLRALSEQASDAGGSALVGERCTGGTSELHCSAAIARAPSGALAANPASSDRAPSAFELALLEGEPRALAARAIRVDVDVRSRDPGRRARRATDVGERAMLPVSHVEVGSLRAHCPTDACRLDELRGALRIAAGGLGVSDLVGVRCLAFEDEKACVAALAVSESDPERDARAR